MLRIEPTEQKNFINTKANKKQEITTSAQNNGEKKAIIGTLSGLAVLGLAAIGLKKTATMSYEEALKKSGVQIKDGIATLIESGEKFSGKVQRFEKRNRKETVKFVDGVMTERLYYTALGKETEGYFYKGDACYHSSRYQDSLFIGGKDSGIMIDGTPKKAHFFNNARKHVASPYFDKLVQKIKEAKAKRAAKGAAKK